MPYVAITEITIPAEYFLLCPASTKVMGITGAVPHPTRQNPITDVQKYGSITESKMPVMIKHALMIYIRAIPTLSMMLSETKRDVAIQIINVRYPQVNT